MRVYFTPPEQTDEGEPFPPFEFTRGDPKVFASPHRYFRKEDYREPAGRLLRPDGKPRVDVRGNEILWYTTKTRWVLDEEKNRELDAGVIDPPDNSLELVQSDINFIRNYHPEMVPYLITEETLAKQRQAKRAGMRRRHEEELAEFRAEMEAKQKKLLELREAKAKELAEAEAELERARSARKKALVPVKTDA